MFDLNEFEVGGHVYRIRARMDGKVASRLLRRCLPIMSPILGFNATAPDITVLRQAIAEFGKLSDEAEDYIFESCLRLVDRKQGEIWAPVKPKNAPDLMFNDIDVFDRWVIVVNVVRREFEPVFQKARAFPLGGAGETKT